ncbi:hypothetical protein J6590_088719 [Homalodisca vitripennis]|nr:hypothetical protein J6590_088719 [Homalodisca vitripennis]
MVVSCKARRIYPLDLCDYSNSHYSTTRNPGMAATSTKKPNRLITHVIFKCKCRHSYDSGIAF